MSFFSVIFKILLFSDDFYLCTLIFACITSISIWLESCSHFHSRLCSQDGVEDAEDPRKGVRSETVDLTDDSLVVDISDALSEKEKVKFTVHTKVIVDLFPKYWRSVLKG